MGLPLNVISMTNRKCITRFKVARHKFPQAAWALEQIDTETCHVSMATWRQFWPIENCAPF
jgi:hypothetical protein